MSLRACMCSHMSAHTRLRAQTSAHTNFGAHTSLGAHTRAHMSACMCAFLPREPALYEHAGK